jgi:hypothetical protein
LTEDGHVTKKLHKPSKWFGHCIQQDNNNNNNTFNLEVWFDCFFLSWLGYQTFLTFFVTVIQTVIYQPPVIPQTQAGALVFAYCIQLV